MTAPTFNTELPTTKEELSRKSLETLEFLLRRHQQGKISTAQLDVALDTLFGTVNGLIDREFVELITQASKESVIDGKDASYFDRRLFIGVKGDLVLIEREYGATAFFIRKQPTQEGWAKHSKKSFADEINPEKSAAEAMQKVVAGLIRLGYREL